MRYGQRKASSRSGPPALQSAHTENDLKQLSTYLESEQDRGRVVYGRHGFEARTDSAGSRGAQQSASPRHRSREGEPTLCRVSTACVYVWCCLHLDCILCVLI